MRRKPSTHYISTAFVWSVIITHDINANEGDKDSLTSKIIDRDGDSDNGDNEFTKGHASGTDEEKTPATESLNTPHTRQRHKYIDNTCCDSDEETVSNPGILEKGSPIVKNEIDCKNGFLSFHDVLSSNTKKLTAGKLLPSVKKDTAEGTE